MESKIIFKNEPKLSEHEADSKFNERRIALIPKVEKFISSHERFKGKEANVIFAHKGVSSLVCIIETLNEKVVLKIHLSINRSMDEGMFLSIWEQVGVKVPHVIEEGMLDEHAYVLMEYIDAPVLGDKFSQGELIEKDLYFEMGVTLCSMHEPKGKGYGLIINGRAEFSSFKNWLSGEYMQKIFNYAKDNSILGEEHGSLSKACEILTEYTNNEENSSYCHFDFGANNIFATNPITVFDPSPQFNNRYIDLGRSIVIYIANNGLFPKQMVDGYFSREPYNEKVLHSAILLNSYQKFSYWSKTNKSKQIENVKRYLLQTKNILDC